MIIRNLRRMLAAWTMVAVYLLTPKRDKTTILAIALCAKEMRDSID